MDIERKRLNKYESQKANNNEKIVLEHRSSFEQSGREIPLLRPARRESLLRPVTEFTILGAIVGTIIWAAAAGYHQRTEPGVSQQAVATPITSPK